MTAPGPAPVDEIEALVAECIARWRDEGDAAIDDVCERRSELADRIRSRLDRLRTLGFFGDERPATRPFGHYRLLLRLGQGGMGVVHLALDERLGRLVALKALRGAEGADERARTRFRREVEAIARAQHPSIVPIYDVGESEGIPYYTMPYVEGATLARVLGTLVAEQVAPDDVDVARVRQIVQSAGGDDGAADALGHGVARIATHGDPDDGWPDDGLRWMCQVVLDVADALDHVHEQGIVHRDVKPSNVLIDVSGRARLFDFGLAALEDGATLTLSGDFLGTPQYVSPEQVSGDSSRIDRRTDVYSLGVTLYEMLTLHAPFRGPSTRHVFHAIEVAQPPAPERRHPGLPRDLATICLTAMAKDRERRYRTAAEMAADLRRFLAGRPIAARPPGPIERTGRFVRNHRVLVGSATAVLLALGGGLLSTRRALDEAESSARIARERGVEASRLAEVAARRLAETERLADALLTRELTERAESLWPLSPALIPAIETWLEQADALAARAPIHEEYLAQREETRDDGTTEADLAERWRVETTRQLLADIGLLGPVVADVQARLEFARTIEQRTIGDHADAWERARAAVADDPRFAGLDLAPQLGLVPLGPDPATGLWEFWHPQTGERPVRDPESGRLLCDGNTGIVLVLIPGGRFTMGATPFADESDDASAPRQVDPWAERREAPVHDVTLGPFFLSKYEMTQGQWRRITGSNPSYYNPSLQPPGVRPTEASPVESVTWSEADLWLRRLGLVLPTEAQWEYAARAGTTTPWTTGDDPTSLVGHVNLGDQTSRRHGAPAAWAAEPWLEDGAVVHAPVGLYAANPWGLHDVLGNVAEWCRERFAYYDVPVAEGDGERGRGEWGEDRMVRGGHFGGGAREARCASRTSGQPDKRNESWGVRPSRSLDGS